jgi:hypothetical protein
MHYFESNPQAIWKLWSEILNSFVLGSDLVSVMLFYGYCCTCCDAPIILWLLQYGLFEADCNCHVFLLENLEWLQ